MHILGHCIVYIGRRPIRLLKCIIHIFFVLGPFYRPGLPKTRPVSIEHIEVKGYISVDETDIHSPFS